VKKHSITIILFALASFYYLTTDVIIAEDLFITERTVKFHITNIFHKTGAKNRLELLIMWSKKEE